MLVDEDDFATYNYDTECSNRMRLLQTMRDTAANSLLAEKMKEAEPEAESGDSNGSAGGLSLVEAGVIGAITTRGVIIIFVMFSFWAGVIALGRNLNPK